jgi:hypothetical protein
MPRLIASMTRHPPSAICVPKVHKHITYSIMNDMLMMPSATLDFPVDNALITEKETSFIIFVAANDWKVLLVALLWLRFPSEKDFWEYIYSRFQVETESCFVHLIFGFGKPFSWPGHIITLFSQDSFC